MTNFGNYLVNHGRLSFTRKVPITDWYIFNVVRSIYFNCDGSMELIGHLIEDSWSKIGMRKKKKI